VGWSDSLLICNTVHVSIKQTNKKMGKRKIFQDDRFSGDQGLFIGWKQFILRAKSVYQHGITDLCLGTVNSSSGRDLSHTASVAFVSMTTMTVFFSLACNETEHFGLSKSYLSKVTTSQYLEKGFFFVSFACFSKSNSIKYILTICGHTLCLSKQGQSVWGS